MGKIRIAINGFGRIGRVFCRAIQNSEQIELVAVNDLTDNQTLAHLLKYDSVHGQFTGSVSASSNGLMINGKEVRVFEEKDPSNLPWSELSIDVVVESTGIFRTKEKAGKHLEAGAKKVIISAPAKGGDVPGIVMGINHHQIPDVDIISNASCTTNCAAPMVAVLDQLCEITSGFITTVHAYTGDQRIHDAPHRDLRRARAAANSIIPTSTGAASAVGEIFPHLNGKLDGTGVRVPVIDGSLTELTCTVKKAVSAEELNAAFNNAANNQFKGILEYTNEPLVSCDIVGNPHSCIFDSDLTKVQGNQVQIVGWYDNEFGYSNRLVDLILELSK
ncbi:type I glyceraldehyde-3-phosphate dehydrogenase [Parvicella tangerina]|uniref:Glyceraldehyde-3-phosphate dehydrogenase n=1 Tax=Parvicella tangerina TaxID=2829795 RepID=A0A916JNR9_9FLAO|nr:type I glyceraldehyde-3-phosphate dehydrogenase [Parvicella tangerina]CAG5084514.1 Glyceraldehyde-3-phosphate dehydrogenase [Parvicella tangerina]